MYSHAFYTSNNQKQVIENGQHIPASELIKDGKLKIYIGMSAGVGKTYRMLQEAHQLQADGLNVRLGYIETHGRKETHALLEGLTQVPRREVFYKGKKLEELDVQGILLLHPDIVLIDELAQHAVRARSVGKPIYLWNCA